MLRVVEKPSKENEEVRATLDEVLQRGALKMLQEKNVDISLLGCGSAV